MADTLQLEVLTPAGRIFSEAVREAVVPTTGGALGIFPNHTPLATVAQLGVVQIRHKAEDSTFDHVVISDGIIEVGQERVRILVDDAEHVGTIDELVEKERLEAAKQARDKAESDKEIATAEAAIARATTWLGAAKLRK